MNEAEYSFGSRLAQLRQSAGLSQQGLADQLSVTRQAVSNWEREQTLPDLDTLRSIARVLGTDLNTLGGSAAPVQRRCFHKSFLAGALAACLCGALVLGGYWASRELLPLQRTDTALSAPLAPHRARYTAPNGVTIVVAADGRQELASLLAGLPEGGAGPVEITAELADTFSYFAQQYNLCFAPEYSEGDFSSSWDQVLVWLYRSGISHGGIMSEDAVDAAVEDRFGSDISYRHHSTENFPLTEEGYWPNCGAYTISSYTLTALNRQSDGAYQAVVQEEGGPAITVTFVLNGESLRFQRIVRTEESL